MLAGYGGTITCSGASHYRGRVSRMSSLRTIALFRHRPGHRKRTRHAVEIKKGIRLRGTHLSISPWPTVCAFKQKHPDGRCERAEMDVRHGPPPSRTRTYDGASVIKLMKKNPKLFASAVPSSPPRACA